MYAIPAQRPENRLKGCTISNQESAKEEKRAYPVNDLPIDRYKDTYTRSVIDSLPNLVNTDA